MTLQITHDDLDLFLSTLPPRLRTPLSHDPDKDELVEVIMDLGRVPHAIFHHKQCALSETAITAMDLAYAIKRLGAFGADNRAGIARTLHRFSALRNRRGDIIGLTCRVGRAVQGTAEIIRDLVESGKSLLIMGRPGIGKTTLLREAARILSEEGGKRVVIVDTSNEIAGDGDIPHPGIGRARRMQVPHPDQQHQVMIEAVENHMPECIVIDEMGSTLEAEAARTIAERGVQLIATAHGNTLDNLMANPTLNDLIGGIESVTLGDEEAKRRGSQKTVLERRAPATFQILIEILRRWEMIIHLDVANSVDLILQDQLPYSETRQLKEDGTIVTEQTVHPKTLLPASKRSWNTPAEEMAPDERPVMRLFYLGITRRHIKASAANLGILVDLVEDARDADLILSLKKLYRQHPHAIRKAEESGVPVFVIKEDNRSQVEIALKNLLEYGTLTRGR